MTNPKNKTVKADGLLDDIRKKFVQEENENTGGTRYQQVKEAIRDSLYNAEPNDPLPSIRRFSKVLNVALVSVQRAVTELIGEDLLYSKNGVGLFVKKQPTRSQPMFTGHRTLRKVQDLEFLFHDESDVNRAMMLRIVEKYRENYKGGPVVKLTYEQASPSLNKPDLSVYFECFEHSLDIADFGGHEIEKGELEVLGCYGGVMGYISYYLFYNDALLDSLGVEAPEYQNFEQQVAYIKQVKEAAEKQGVMGPVSWNRPQYFLGRNTMKYLAFLKGNEAVDSTEADHVFDIVGQVMAYYRLFLYDGAGNQRCPGMEAFINGDSPVFTGDTNCISLLEQIQQPRVEWKVYPLFTQDNTIKLSPVYAMINGNTRLPMESVKLLQFMQGKEAQQEFFEQGFITTERQGKYIDQWPFAVQAAKKAFHGYLEDSVDNYIYEHIMDTELIECGIREKSVREAFESIFHYAKGYLRNFATN